MLWLSRRDLDLVHHPGMIVAGDQTCEIEVAGLVERPYDLARFPGGT